MLDFSDVTYLIPIRIDCPQRLVNVELAIDHLFCICKTNVIIFESGRESCCRFLDQYPGIQYLFECDEGPFHKTRILNRLTQIAPTHICANLDADVLLEERNHFLSIELIRGNQAKFVWPYSRQIIPRRNISPKGKVALRSSRYQFDRLSCGCHYRLGSRREDGGVPHTVGGAVFYDRAEYTKAGGQNEEFIGWGREDSEFFARIERLNIATFLDDRFAGEYYCYHLSHPRSCCKDQPTYIANDALAKRLAEMSDCELKAYYSSVS